MIGFAGKINANGAMELWSIGIRDLTDLELL